MTGSLHDSDDLTQETLVKAWRGLASFGGRASFRTWLYRVATNVCVDAHRSRRLLPPGLASPADPLIGPQEFAADRVWLEPYPDTLLEAVPAHPSMEPEAQMTRRESVRLAFLAAVQTLPAKQRAILLLRDVLGFTASEAAAIVETTVPAANSALQRARATLASQPPYPDARAGGHATADEASLVGRYVLAFEGSDVAALVELIREDAIMSMPPDPAWFQGRADILAYLANWVFPRFGPLRALPTAANGVPAVALYGRRADGLFEALSLQVVDLRLGRIAEITGFVDPSLFRWFNLPGTLAPR